MDRHKVGSTWHQLQAWALSVQYMPSDQVCLFFFKSLGMSISTLVFSLKLNLIIKTLFWGFVNVFTYVQGTQNIALHLSVNTLWMHIVWVL